MRIKTCFPLLAPLLLGIPSQLLGITVPFNCNGKIPLQTAIDLALPGTKLVLSGTCSGPLVINRGNLILESRSGTVIDGGKKDAITINGAANVTLDGLDIRNGMNGILANNGARLNVVNTNIHDNAVMGIQLLGSSSVALSGGSVRKNATNGIDAEGSSSVVINGPYTAEANGVFGININGASSLTLTEANLMVNGNILGIQIGTSASAFISDANTRLTVMNNITTGLTVVSGSHMVAFGGTISATGNGVHGVSVDSKAGLDLDAAAVLTSTGNTQDGVHLEETSVLTMFNTPSFSGAPGITTLNVSENGGNGVSVLTGSGFTIIHQAALNSTANKGFGVFADNGSSITLIQAAVTGNAMRDVSLTFGSRADLTNPLGQMPNNIGTVACDSSTSIRGTAITCPR